MIGKLSGECTPTIIIFVTPYVYILSPETMQTGARTPLDTYAAAMDKTIMLDLDG